MAPDLFQLQVFFVASYEWVAQVRIVVSEIEWK